MDVRQLKTDFRSGRLSADELLDAVDKLHQTVKRLQGEVDRLTQRLAQYEPGVLQEARSSGSQTPPSSSRYSLDAEEQRRRDKQRRRRRKKKSPGRRPNRVKFADVHHTEDVYPPHTPHDQCQLVRQRAVWRLVKGSAVLIGYPEVFAAVVPLSSAGGDVSRADKLANVPIWAFHNRNDRKTSPDGGVEETVAAVKGIAWEGRIDPLRRHAS